MDWSTRARSSRLSPPSRVRVTAPPTVSGGVSWKVTTLGAGLQAKAWIGSSGLQRVW